MKKALIFGAGISGLASANLLAKNGFLVSVVEMDEIPGGLSGTHIDQDGSVYDRGPHYFFTTLADKIGIRDKCFRVPYYESIFWKNRYYSFPFGLLKNVKFLVSVLGAYGKNIFSSDFEGKDLLELLNHHYGKGFCSEILSPLISKWSGVNVESISTDFGKRLLPGNIKYIVYSLIKRIRGYTEDYYQKGRYIVYPHGGMKTVFNAFTAQANLKIEFNEQIKEIKIEGKKIIGVRSANKNYEADYYVSSIPVDSIVSSLQGNGILKEKIGDFKYRGIVLLYLKLQSGRVINGLWNWYPESEYPFYRISEQIENDPNRNTKENGKNVMIFEFGSFPHEKIWKMNDNDIFEIGVAYIQTLFGISKKLVRGYKVERMRAAYPILLKEYETKQRLLDHKVGIDNLFLVGRTGSFKYHMLEESYDSGIEAAKEIIKIF